MSGLLATTGIGDSFVKSNGQFGHSDNSLCCPHGLKDFYNTSLSRGIRALRPLFAAGDRDCVSSWVLFGNIQRLGLYGMQSAAIDKMFGCARIGISVINKGE
jgi:hypothetical protein